MSNYNVVNQFNLESDNFRIHVSFNTPIKFEPNWTYYIKLLNVQFSNVVPNVETDLYVSGVKMCDIGVYNIGQLISKYNDLGSYGELSLNPNTGKLDLSVFSNQLQKSGKTLNDYKNTPSLHQTFLFQ